MIKNEINYNYFVTMVFIRYQNQKYVTSVKLNIGIVKTNKFTKQKKIALKWKTKNVYHTVGTVPKI